MKFLFSSPSGPEVGLLKGLLDEAGIACEIRNESTYTNLPGAGFQPEIWIANEDDYAKACELRGAWQASSKATAEGLLEHAESARSNALLRGVVGVALLAAAMVLTWRFARLGDWGPVGGAVIFFGVPGVVLVWSAAPELRRRTKR